MKIEKKSEANKCQSCESYKRDMCVCKNPNINMKPFGFPFRFHPSKVDCKSWKKKEPFYEITWEHM